MYRDALSRINMNEEIMPFIRGKILQENVDIYAKIQKILSCDRMANCHRFLYDLDIENLTESEISKVCNLYKLGQDRGVIELDKDEEAEAVVQNTPSPAPEVPSVPQVPQTPQLPMSAYNVLYSAMRDGQIKTGEAFSNAINTRSAKADVINKLERAGYQNISILAIEAGDPDMAGCSNTSALGIKEADVREPLSHALAPVDINASTANSISQDAVATSLREDDEKEASKESDAVSDSNTDDSTEEDADSNADDSNDEETASDDSENDDSEDKETDKEADKDTDKEETAEEPDEKLKADDSTDDDKKDGELSDVEKSQLKDSYKKAFKAAMIKCKYVDKSFDDLTLEEKVKFFTELSRAWDKKTDPSKFMTDKEMEALEAIVIKK